MPRRGRFLTFPWGKVPPQRRKRGGARSDNLPPHTRQGFALPPSPRRGFRPPPEVAFPYGEGGPGAARAG